jgi:type VI protein secretion system component Hcp
MLKTKLLTAALATVVASLAATGSAHAGTDYFMKVQAAGGTAEPIVGESLDREFPQTIEIDSFSFGAENKLSIGSTSGGAGTGKATLNELTVEKAVDSTTPRFLRTLGMGTHFANVEIIARTPSANGGAGVVPIRTLFTMVAVTKQEQSGSAGEPMRETLTFVYGGVAQASVSPKSPVKPNVFSSWSAITNTPLREGLIFPYNP